MQKHQIVLNFWPLLNDDFTFAVYRKRRVDASSASPEGAIAHKLPVMRGGEEYVTYWVSSKEKPGWEKFQCLPDDNVWLTPHFLLRALVNKSRRSLDAAAVSVEGKINPRVEYLLQSHEKGEQRVWLRPYNLRRSRDFGYLVGYRFKLRDEAEYDREAQRLSLSLDQRYRENYDYYASVYDKIDSFAKKYFHTLFPIDLGEGGRIQVERKLKRLTAPILDKRTYVFKGEETSNSQFMGMKSNGPLKKAPNDALIFFVYKPEHKQYSYDLFRAIRGDTFQTFPGMDNMFGFSLGEEHVKGIPISEFNEDGISQVINGVREQRGERLTVPVVITPWDKTSAGEAEEYSYYLMKHRFLQAGLPSQFVSLNTLKDKKTLKWSTSNIALGIFSKMGGVPWKVDAEHKRCLIIGIGQSHRWVDDEIQRYFAYSVLTDASGIYKDLETLGKSRDENKYINEFKEKLLEILRDHETEFDTFVLHSTFRMRGEEMRAMKEVLETYRGSKTDAPNLVALKFNHKNDYFGFAPNNNSMVPRESTVLPLSYTDFLVWFEGLRPGKKRVKSRIGSAMHMQLLYPNSRELSEAQKRSYLQDALNLSGTNWRGFNAKSRPVSVYYASQIAKYFRAFDEYGFDEVKLSNMTPWFL